MTLYVYYIGNNALWCINGTRRSKGSWDNCTAPESFRLVTQSGPIEPNSSKKNNDLSQTVQSSRPKQSMVIILLLM